MAVLKVQSPLTAYAATRQVALCIHKLAKPPRGLSVWFSPKALPLRRKMHCY